MKSMICCVGMVGFFVTLAIGETAYAQPFVQGTAAACQPGMMHNAGGQWTALSTGLAMSDYGLMNVASSTQTAYCPLLSGTNYSSSVPVPNGVVVWYWDGTTTVPFRCQVVSSNYDLSHWWSSSLYTCSAPGGCLDSTAQWGGGGYLYFAVAAGLSPSSIFVANTVMTVCDIPPSAWTLGNVTSITAVYTQ